MVRPPCCLRHYLQLPFPGQQKRCSLHMWAAGRQQEHLRGWSVTSVCPPCSNTTMAVRPTSTSLSLPLPRPSSRHRGPGRPWQNCQSPTRRPMRSACPPLSPTNTPWAVSEGCPVHCLYLCQGGTYIHLCWSVPDLSAGRLSGCLGAEDCLSMPGDTSLTRQAHDLTAVPHGQLIPSRCLPFLQHMRA